MMYLMSWQKVNWQKDAKEMWHHAYAPDGYTYSGIIM